MRHALFALLLPLTLIGCATMGGGSDPTAGLENPEVRSRTVSGGDTIDEYYVAGQLRVVRITPARGPVYYLVDNNADGILDSSKGEGPISPVQYKLLSW
ncbi:DUF2782 domain-containing protein [Lysobacter auxotrophicus]|uniref:DUF2782 domain-containing protein n=1 Tax=Lysobacter auxotrophicus TaxID=2992573 RepID=A0ABM8D968_9GAMM|nr:DUF2782 domain-containing protein [Lysobacter auxotrophicus]BDU15090.1 DUF2782 domain-containing protein [Lysobacter auxotrophicus]